MPLNAAPLPHPELADRLSVAARLAREAGGRILQIASSGLTQARKPDHSLVTNADHASDRFIREGLQAAFPQDAILTEEAGSLGPIDSRRLWVVDPLDGTKAFVRRVPGFCVMLGLLDDGKPALGVVYDPLSGWLYQAVAGCGASGVPPGQTRRVPLQVSTRRDPHTMALIGSPGMPEEWRHAFHQRIGLLPGPTINSVGIKVGLLVRQEGDVYFNHHSVSFWDTVAPILIAQEAGAIATLLDGQPFEYDLKAVPLVHHGPSLITNGTCHDRLRQQMADVVGVTAE
ncbi:MAG: 3'(2'),5'-bisphosphate nucleotidase CysQ [Planctomycetes bacterium]|nr:3'(2'),5'-bisphosphate nucleotidase CysQ [Planctomycetota bacterium]